jgi:hypothetical protein
MIWTYLSFKDGNWEHRLCWQTPRTKHPNFYPTTLNSPPEEQEDHTKKKQDKEIKNFCYDFPTYAPLKSNAFFLYFLAHFGMIAIENKYVCAHKKFTT